MTPTRSDTHARPPGGREKGAALTRGAVERQLAAMDCERLDVLVYDRQAAKITRTLERVSVEGILTSVPMLRAMNVNGCDIYIRPHGSVGLVLVDDVMPAALTQMHSDGLTPTLTVQTSWSKFQAWVRMSASAIPAELASAAARELAGRYDADRAAANWRQPGRLAGFTNRKAEYRQPNGNYPFAKVVQTQRGVAPAGATLLASVVPDVDRDVSSLARDDASFPAPRGARVCALVEEYRQRVAEHRARHVVDDYSRLDWMITKEMTRAHPDVTAEDLAWAIRDGSPTIELRKLGHLWDYCILTARKVLAQAAREQGGG